MDLIEQSKAMSAALAELPIDIRAELLNEIRANLHEVSPFKTEPVDFVRWVPAPKVVANDYNPNAVAPPEMDLLRVSIMADGYTQPIVTNQEDDNLVVIDGFHRNRVGKECEDVRARVHGFLPVVQIRQSQLDRGDRIASTIRHNRARGKHRVQAMSDIVIELKKRNWTDDRIAKNLGMDKDEILRLCQISGLSELFSDQSFSQAWDVEGAISEEDFKELTDDIATYGEDLSNTRTVNTNDDGRIFHTYEGWECHEAGFYQGSKKGWTKKQCEEAYRDFLSDLPRFEVALEAVVTTWKISCEHYLTNSAMNRIAWLGQAAACHEMGIPSTFRGGFYLMTEDQQNAANEMALKYLNKWLVANGRQEMTLEEAYSYDRQSDIY
jgi:ParB-like chromosome segregation protein Spo0J